MEFASRPSAGLILPKSFVSLYFMILTSQCDPQIFSVSPSLRSLRVQRRRPKQKQTSALLLSLDTEYGEPRSAGEFASRPPACSMLQKSFVALYFMILTSQCDPQISSVPPSLRPLRVQRRRHDKNESPLLIRKIAKTLFAKARMLFFA